MKSKIAIKVHQFLSFSKIFNTVNPAPKENKTKYLFFPGCSLPSYNPKIVGEVLDHLQEKLDMEVGSMLKCCGKPTKNMGTEEKFNKRFLQVEKEIEDIGAEIIVVTCQSCFEVLRLHGKRKVVSLWEILQKIGLPKGCRGIGDSSEITFNIHDSCSGRDEKNVHDGIRWILKEMGYKVEELENSREKTVCCGLGGLAAHGDQNMSRKMMSKRASESTTGHVVSYCAACRASMETGGADSLHILDLVFGDVYKTESVQKRNSGILKQWGNRLKSKRELDKRK